MEPVSWIDKLSSLTVFPEVYKDLAQPGVKKVGIAIGDALEFVFLPTRFMKHGTDRVNIYLERNLENCRKKLNDTPEEKIVSVAPELSVPIVQKLSYTSSKELSQLFINLLSKASNVDTAGEAHPAYISIIESLSVDEAKILRVLRSRENVIYSSIRLLININGDYTDLFKYITFVNNMELSFPGNTEAYFSHFVGLGLLDDMKPAFIVDSEKYRKLKDDNQQIFAEFEGKVLGRDPNYKLEWVDSFLEITGFGKAFLKACVPEIKLTVTGSSGLSQ